jgi:hypothetical protein
MQEGRPLRPRTARARLVQNECLKRSNPRSEPRARVPPSSKLGTSPTAGALLLFAHCDSDGPMYISVGSPTPADEVAYAARSFRSTASRFCCSSAARARVTPVSRPRVHPKARAQARSPCSPSATYESSGNSENGDRRCGLPRAGGSGWPRATTTPTVVRRPQSRTASRSLPPPGGRTPARAAQLTRSPGRLPPRTCARSPRA